MKKVRGHQRGLISEATNLLNALYFKHYRITRAVQNFNTGRAECNCNLFLIHHYRPDVVIGYQETVVMAKAAKELRPHKKMPPRSLIILLILKPDQYK